MAELTFRGEESVPLLQQNRKLSFPKHSSIKKEDKKEKEHYFTDSYNHSWKTHFSVGVHQVRDYILL